MRGVSNKHCLLTFFIEQNLFRSFSPESITEQIPASKIEAEEAIRFQSSPSNSKVGCTCTVYIVLYAD